MIGIFDSGLGGLTVLKAIRKEMPSIDVLYFGDTRNAPYGLKSRQELSSLTVQAIQLLRKRGARNILTACNTVSASVTVSLLDTFSLSSLDLLLEMVGPTVSYFKDSTARLLLCATPATIHSEMYQNAFSLIGQPLEVFSIPELAGAIESGASNEVLEEIIRKSFESINLQDFDILILACTHYPLVADIFQKVVGNSVLVFDPAIAVAERVKKQLWPREMADGKTTFILSSDSEPFRTQAAKLFPKGGYSIEILK